MEKKFHGMAKELDMMRLELLCIPDDAEFSVPDADALDTLRLAAKRLLEEVEAIISDFVGN